ncbi:hypothetical protein CASFOL_029152 [Castilleja foliolosa]|uniref:glycerophosphodiester phosphodiesterase n=1 Tax=Castilleja foliolosa TaxID=1961234 RepID=A0ABD3CBI0_9LAMI
MVDVRRCWATKDLRGAAAVNRGLTAFDLAPIGEWSFSVRLPYIGPHSDDEDDTEEIKAPSSALDCLTELENSLPLKRGLSSCYAGKPKSFGNLTDFPLDDSNDLTKKEHHVNKKLFASGFANDVPLPYNYSYDPVSEYLSFIDNRQFSVDGVVADFPVTPSATIDCYAFRRINDTVFANISVISNEGASTDYPGCTDLAYNKAVSDGVDILDCPVQITSDGIPICFGSINVRDRTNAAQSEFLNRATNNPELNIVDGIFTYNLTWEEIQSLRPAIYNPYGANYTLYRNPNARAAGNFMQLSDFLAYVNNQSPVSGVLITIENAAYVAANQSLGVTDAVLSSLSDAGYNNRTTKRVMIRSSDSADGPRTNVLQTHFFYRCKF